MPKVKTISRNKRDFTRDRIGDPLKVFRNYNPTLHPYEKHREYTRALNAVKLDKIFAKPFLYALDSHRDGIWTMCSLPTSLVTMASGACDGEIRIWNLANRKLIWNVQAHTRFVRGICSDDSGKNLLTCSDDKTIKIWAIDQSEALENKTPIEPLNTLLGKNDFSGIDHHRDENMFATSGAQVDLWDANRIEPIHSFDWGADSIFTVKFNCVQTNILGATSSDRNIILYDVRKRLPLRKLILTNNSNAMCWNPQEAYHFTVANDDGNSYTFDMRFMKRAKIVHEDHVSGVIAVDYSPTGQEIVTGGYDRTIRIYNVVGGDKSRHSREVYYTKRMNRIFSVLYSADNTYVLSGSGDCCIRLWKAKASKRLSVLLPREERKEDYYEKLKEKYKHAPEIRRIARHRHVPKYIQSARLNKHRNNQSILKGFKNKQKHATPGLVKWESVTSKKVIGEKE